MEDLGPPVAYTALQKGIDVYDVGGERVGEVEHVLADDGLDIFDGLVVQTPLPSGRHLFADVDQIAELHERGVLLSVGHGDLHEPGKGPAAMEAHADDSESPLHARLRRAWDWISGNR